MSHSFSRRKFIHNLGLTALALPILSAVDTCLPKNNKKKLGVALVGLGSYAEGQLAPALQQTEHCYLAGIVTGTPSKAGRWKAKYNIPDKNIYTYKTIDNISNNNDIDIVYIVLPNSLHAEYCIRASQAGKHVICEKPMAITVADCDAMIAASKNAGKKLSIGYRLHFDEYHKEMMRLGRKQVYGKLKTVNADFAFHAQSGIWRLDKELAGGGPLMDLGIYCVQSFCYTTGLEPLAVTAQEGAKTDALKFKEVEQSLTWQFEMPGGIKCNGKTSYEDSYNNLRAEAENEWFELSPAFSYNGIRGKTSQGEIKFKNVFQQALQMDDFALAVINNRPTPVPGEMGRRDVKYLQAIYQAMRTGERVIIPKD